VSLVSGSLFTTYHIMFRNRQARPQCVPWWYVGLPFLDFLPPVGFHPGNDSHTQLLVLQLIISALLVYGAQRGALLRSPAVMYAHHYYFYCSDPSS